MQCTGRTEKHQLWLEWSGVVWGRICGPEHQRRGGILMRKSSRNLHRSPLEVLFSWIPNGCMEGKPLLRLGRKKQQQQQQLLGKNNYYGVVNQNSSHSSPMALRSNHIPTNQIEKSSLNTQNIQKRPDYSDSLKLCKSEDNGKIFRIAERKNNLKTKQTCCWLRILHTQTHFKK